jgi:hypothetical protein
MVILILLKGPHTCHSSLLHLSGHHQLVASTVLSMVRKLFMVKILQQQLPFNVHVRLLVVVRGYYKNGMNDGEWVPTFHIEH